LRVGVLALQGDFREHLKALEHCGVQGVEVRRVSELESVDALIIPGGESTTIVSLAKTFELFEPIKKRITEGMPVYGSCAGMIMLADHIVAAKDGQETFGGTVGSSRQVLVGY
jgi:5'-phosphate synthase pdxT subunit